MELIIFFCSMLAISPSIYLGTRTDKLRRRLDKLEEQLRWCCAEKIRLAKEEE